MSSLEKFCSLALSFEGAKEKSHFDKRAFTYASKIFATLNEKEQWATLKFKPEEQEWLCKVNPQAIFPVPNKFGKMGWTHVRYASVPDHILEELLLAAYITVRPKFRTDSQ
jgi:predicted DNA-binding protein (MmcQ/YjbR family)